MLRNKPTVEWLFELNEKIQKTYRYYQDTNNIDGEFISKVTHNTITVKLESEEVYIYDNMLARWFKVDLLSDT